MMPIRQRKKNHLSEIAAKKTNLSHDVLIVWCTVNWETKSASAQQKVTATIPQQ